VTERSSEIGWRTPVGLGLLTAVGAFFVVGPLGGVVGLIAGALAARRVRATLLGAGAALLVAALLTILEQPLTQDNVNGFPGDHPLANLAGAIAAVFLLGGLIGMLAKGDYPLGRTRAEPIAGPPERVPISTIAAVLAAMDLGALTLSLLGDQLWETAALVLTLTLTLTLALLLALQLWPASRRK